MIMICPAAMTIFEFKEEVIKLKEGTEMVKRYLAGVSSAERLQVYAAGTNGRGNGKPLPDDMLVPRNSNSSEMFTVMKLKPKLSDFF